MPEPIRCCIDRPRPHLPAHSEEMAAQRASLWTPGQTIRIAFRGGTMLQRRAVIRAAAVWMSVASIRIEQVTRGPAELRCTFEPGGSWSMVGKDCLSVPANEPTMNMGWPDDPGRDLHELGHALGCIHEHQSPAAGIEWNVPACLAYFGAPPNSWPPDEVQSQVFDRYAQAEITNSVYDPHSVMHYWFPPQLTLKPLGITGPNQSLSAQDIAFIGQLYPKAK